MAFLPQVAVTKHNESEQTSTSVYTGADPFDPVMNFQSYIDNNDRIEDEVRPTFDSD